MLLIELHVPSETQPSGARHNTLIEVPMFAQASSVCTGLEVVARIEEFEGKKRDHIHKRY
jgi:hypothetical protein